MPIHAVAVFCGSRSGRNDLYKQEAEALGTLLAQHRIGMVYGGGRNGLMGYIADAVMRAGGTVRGVMPQLLIDKESGHTAISELIVVETMHERKRRLYELCDAAVILPGGVGTLDEFFEIITWNALTLHDKKVFLLNTAGFYNHLLRHLEQLAAEGFLYEDLKNAVTVLDSAAAFEEHIG